MNRGIELKASLVIWYALAVLLPDLVGFATRDWRAAVAAACLSVLMIALSLRLPLGGLIPSPPAPRSS